ncbi:MAG TPA: prohibitin family protein [Steroidobacteraceae bacterium]|jgi:regulator of protease activity HflC (stomatin/prohibitin superfamily)|nr:prohibitin family protein [Steroidobacteraceae bacterium]
MAFNTPIFRGNNNSGDGGGRIPIGRIAMWLVVAVIAVVVVSVAGCGIKVVDTGQRGIKTRFGEVVSESLPEGLYFFNPFTSAVVEMDTRVQRQDGETDTYTRDVQQAAIKYTLNYRLQQNAAHLMYRDIGRDWEQKLIPQVVLGTLKEVVGKWDAVDLIANRDKAGNTAFEAIRGNLAERNVEVSRFEITDIAYTHEFENSVEQKVIAQQKAIEEQNRTKQIEEQARQKVLSAEAEAKSIQIRAQALERNAKLVEWEAVQKWNGVLPQYMLGGSATPFINLNPGKD